MRRKPLKNLKNEITKTLEWYFKKSNMTPVVAERACICLHRTIDETYRKCFADAGMDLEQKNNNRQNCGLAVKEEKTNGTFEDLGDRLCAIFEKTGVPKDIYIDTGAPYEPWEKEDVENSFTKMHQSSSQMFDKQITSSALDKYSEVADAYRKLEKRAIRNHLGICNAPHQEKDSSV